MIIEIKVLPRSKTQKIEPMDKGYKIWVRSAPDRGSANKEVIKVLSHFLGIPPSRLQIVRGHSSRHKWIELDAAGIRPSGGSDDHL